MGACEVGEWPSRAKSFAFHRTAKRIQCTEADRMKAERSSSMHIRSMILTESFHDNIDSFQKLARCFAA